MLVQTSRRVLVNAITRWLAVLIQGALGVFLVRFLLDELGTEGYGLAALLGVLVSFATVADLGLGGALARHLAVQVAARDTERYNDLASSAMAFCLVVGGLLALMCSLFAHEIVALLNIPARLSPAAVLLIRWYVSPALLLSFVAPVYSGVITSMHRFDLLNLTTAGIAIARAGSLLMILGLATAGLYGWAACMLFTQGASLILGVWIAHRVYPGLHISPRRARLGGLSTLFSTGAYLFAFQLTSLLSVKADPIILAAFLGPAAVALYTPVTALTGAVDPVVTAFADQLHPLATVYHESGNREKLQELLIRGTRLTCLLGAGACVMLGVFAKPIVHLWVGASLGPDYLVTAQVLAFWVAIDLLAYSAGSQWAVLLGGNHLRFLVWTQLPLAILNVVFSAVLVSSTRLGVVGVVIPTLVIGLIRRPIIIVHTARYCGLSVGHYLRSAYLRPAIVLTILAGAALGVNLVVGPTSAVALLLCGSALGILFVALCWLVGLDAVDRIAVREIVSSVGARRR